MKSFIIFALISLVLNQNLLVNPKFEKNLPFSKSREYVKDTVESFGYLYEEHKITTADGYINTAWRIPAKKETPTKIGKPIILQHGVIDTGFTFVQLKENSIAFLLVNEGYDVWLTNTRGGYCSLDHVELDSSEINGKYWDFSLDHKSAYDLPAFVEYIQKTTGYSKVDYLGHSQGTMIFFLKALDDPEYINKNIGRFIALGAVPGLAHSPNEAFKLLAPFLGAMRTLIPFKKMLFLTDTIHDVLVEIVKLRPDLATKFAEWFTGYEPTGKTNYGDLPEWFHYYPGGTSKQNLLHWLQNYKIKKLTKYDFGSEAKNKEAYGTPEPPEYDPNNYKKWNIPAIIAISEIDTFSCKEDIMDFYDHVEKKELIQFIDAAKYNHGDILNAPIAVTEIFPKILKFLRETNKKNLR
ncbi:MAG: alpha/beta fold hydrolase [archaeon]|nr:alpha/beta fold hydrolase [archaeon]